MGEKEIPEIKLGSGGGAMPSIALGTASFPLVESEGTKSAVVQAIKLGYRHFDTAAIYCSEKSVGEGIADALRLGLIKSRDELFVTTKLWCRDAHSDLVLPALRKSLTNLQLEYVDLYLIHWPVSMKPGEFTNPISFEEICSMDFKSVWEAMEECKMLGLTKSIGVSNFSCKNLEQLLSTAKIIPAVNQVEMHPVWQQKRLREYCNPRGIRVCAYSPLGGQGTPWGANLVMDNETLKEIAKNKGKTIAQVSLRWIVEQGACPVIKSFNEERMKKNLDIFDWRLSEDELRLIDEIPQHRIITGKEYTSEYGPFKSPEELWDDET
ncbi:non-functional NADPH-dependent codeinone reductase 2-like [Aristolochia californica]|uniref:non-functional NADPH-dependent codeinone reductase 2-like n=1 Tax=Aristolochia californica TaxID=171875 RepID=UPI0035DEFA4A